MKAGVTVLACLLATALCAVGATALAASAQEPQPELPPPRPGDRVGIHVVAPGETIWDITEDYLGTSVLWRENWRLNPQIDDPRRLPVGTRLRVITYRPLIDRTAEILEVRREVDQKLAAGDWTPANQGDELKNNDMVRTRERSSAQLGFDDGTDLIMSELSLIVLRQINERLTGVKQQTIEIERGQTDLTARRRSRQASDIEIVVGGARARPRPGAGGLGRSRIRKANDSAAVMVYQGESAVEAAGSTVAVAEGMGTSVREGQPPAPPERLLPRPGGLRPRDRTIGFANPIFAWQRVAGADSYTLEICEDEACARLVATAVGMTGQSWQPTTPLPSGALFWRVRGVSPSGLDGYASQPAQFTIAGSEDREAPVVALIAEGLGQITAASIELGLVGGILLTVHDDVAGVDRVDVRWDDGAWNIWSGEPLTPPSSDVEHSLEIRARDLAGHTAAYGPYAVRRSSARPDPPAVRRAPEPP